FGSAIAESFLRGFGKGSGSGLVGIHKDLHLALVSIPSGQEWDARLFAVAVNDERGGGNVAAVLVGAEDKAAILLGGGLQQLIGGLGAKFGERFCADAFGKFDADLLRFRQGF